MKTHEITAHEIFVSEAIGSVPALLLRPDDARALYVLAHGAGAGMNHPFMASLAEQLATARIATLRYEFPYMAQKKKRPDHFKKLHATVRAAVVAARELAPDLPILAGGKSMGGRMTGNAQGAEALDGVRGLIFVGYPLHRSGQPSTERAATLFDVKIPMLFLQGTRDTLASLPHIETVCSDLGEGATLHVVEAADHSFAVRKKDGRTKQDVADELLASIDGWVTRLLR